MQPGAPGEYIGGGVRPVGECFLPADRLCKMTKAESAGGRAMCGLYEIRRRADYYAGIP